VTSTTTNSAAGEFRRIVSSAPAGSAADSLVARGMGAGVLIGVMLLGTVAAAGLTRVSADGWIAMIFWTMGLWSLWVLWRNARDEVDVPVHVLYPFLAAPGVILLGHLVAGGRAGNGRIDLLANGDTSLLIRLITLGLMLLLVQDTFSRIRELRWLLTGLGATVAAGCVLQLHSGATVPGAPAVAMSGLTGVGILLAPCLLPAWPDEPSGTYLPARWEKAMPVGRIAAAALLAALLMVSESGIPAAAVAAVAVGGSFLLSGAFLKHHRRTLLPAGAILSAGGAVAVIRLRSALPALNWQTTLFGANVQDGFTAHADVAGLRMLAMSTGWVGMVLVPAGMLAALVWSLRACRDASPGDQARSALWAAVAALGGCAVLSEGGLAVPAATAVAALAWGLLPHMMVQRVPRCHGRGVAFVFVGAIMLLGLQRHWAGGHGLSPHAGPGQEMMHLLAGFALTAALLWQARCRRWWQALAAAVPAAGLAVLAEPLQWGLSNRQFEWRDVAWNVAGVAAALGAFLLIRWAFRIEQVLTARPAISFEKYQRPGVLVGPRRWSR